MNKVSIDKLVAEEDVDVVEAMRMIDNNAKGILFIVNENQHLMGSLSDGDIRRWIIKTGDLKGTAREMMNTKPKVISDHDTDQAQEFMDHEALYCVPVLDASGKVVDVIFADRRKKARKIRKINELREVPVIIMAGGKGTRLYPYTKILPKPLIPIGDVPILERIMSRFHKYGVNEFYLTVNYKKEMIKSYFNELSPKYNIHYVEEERPLGTAGSIRLIQDTFHTPVIITNCDILIETDYDKLVKYHAESGNAMTIVSSLKNSTIPYGVLNSKQNGMVISMKEKPQLSYFINTGLYVINPEYMNRIPEDTVFHMTDLAEELIKEGLQVGMYPVSENSFLDMGQFEEMKRMEEKLHVVSN
jgi:dTDP-glucose pyrophosphorylase